MTTSVSLADRAVRAACDAMDAHGISAYLDSDPFVDTHYATVPGWTPGSGRPALATSDLAVTQAMGRCAAARIRWGLSAVRGAGGIHPRPCGFCEYPVEQLLAACSWSLWSGGLILSETLTWTGLNGTTYTLAGRHDVYTNPEHAAFWALPRADRERRIQAAIEASREGMPEGATA